MVYLWGTLNGSDVKTIVPKSAKEYKQLLAYNACFTRAYKGTLTFAKNQLNAAYAKRFGEDSEFIE